MVLVDAIPALVDQKSVILPLCTLPPVPCLDRGDMSMMDAHIVCSQSTLSLLCSLLGRADTILVARNFRARHGRPLGTTRQRVDIDVHETTISISLPF